MSIDYYARAVELLELIANSLIERDLKNPNFLYFSTGEVLLVEKWLKEFKGIEKPESGAKQRAFVQIKATDKEV